MGLAGAALVVTSTIGELIVTKGTGMTPDSLIVAGLATTFFGLAGATISLIAVIKNDGREAGVIGLIVFVVAWAFLIVASESRGRSRSRGQNSAGTTSAVICSQVRSTRPSLFRPFSRSIRIPHRAASIA